MRASSVSGTSVALPPGEDWFLLNSTATTPGGQTVARTDVALDEFPVYVRGGAILPLQGTKIQYSDQVGGLLKVQVYGGRDGDFEMVEDDGTARG